MRATILCVCNSFRLESRVVALPVVGQEEDPPAIALVDNGPHTHRLQKIYKTGLLLRAIDDHGGYLGGPANRILGPGPDPPVLKKLYPERSFEMPGHIPRTVAPQQARLKKHFRWLSTVQQDHSGGLPDKITTSSLGLAGAKRAQPRNAVGGGKTGS